MACCRASAADGGFCCCNVLVVRPPGMQVLKLFAAVHVNEQCMISVRLSLVHLEHTHTHVNACRSIESGYREIYEAGGGGAIILY